MNTTQAYELKTILLGSSGVGKSSLLKRIVSNEFDPITSTTVGCDYNSKHTVCEGKKINVILWDTAGQERFRSLTRMYYTDTNIALLVFDLTNPRTFEDLKMFKSEVIEANEEPVLCVVVGTHLDMLEGGSSEFVDSEVVEEYVEHIHGLYFKVSCSEDNNVATWDNILQSSIRKYITEVNASIIASQEKGETLSSAPRQEENKKKKCC